MKVGIVSGDDRMFRAAAFGLPDRGTIERTYERLESFSRNLSGRAKETIGKARELIDSMFDDSVVTSVRRLESNQRGNYRRDAIQFLDSAEEIALAPQKMRRWLLSDPTVRSLFDRQSIHAWGALPGSYDFEGKGNEDPFHRAIYNGCSRLKEDGFYWSEFEYGLSELTGEELRLDEQLDLIATIDVMKSAMEDGIDPTNPFGEAL